MSIVALLVLMSTWAVEASAWRSTFVSASWTMRKAACRLVAQVFRACCALQSAAQAPDIAGGERGYQQQQSQREFRGLHRVVAHQHDRPNDRECGYGADYERTQPPSGECDGEQAHHH